MSYRCPTCCGHDNDAFVTCHHPACPDGRDQARFARPPIEDEPSNPHALSQFAFGFIACLFAVVFAFLLVIAATHKAKAHDWDHMGKHTEWFESRIRPDQPPNSCCGEADAYPVDRYIKNDDHTYTVWVADGSALVTKEGRVREYWDMATPITVPDNKVNHEDDDLDNPTDHSWIFMRVSTPTDVGTIYCFIRHPNGS
jgi:hypothetical protein